MAINNRKTGLVLSYTSTILNMVCGLLLSSVLLRALGDFEYGLYQTISAFVNYLVIFEFGTGTVMCRNLLVAQKSNDPEMKKKITATMWYITVFLSVFVLIVGFVFFVNIKNIYAKTIPADHMAYAQKLFAVLLIYLLSSFFTQTLSGTHLGNENYNIGNLINIVKVVCRTVILVVAVTQIKLSIGIAIVDASIGLLILIFSLFYVKKKYKFSFEIRYFDTGILKASLPLCFALLLQTVINQANNSVDKFIISIQMNMESVAVYSVAMYIYNVFSSLATIPISMYMPQIAKNMNNGVRGKALTETLVPSGRLVSLVGGTTLCGFIALGKPFINIIYGEQYGVAWITAVIILIPMFINMTGGSIINVLDILNKRQIRSYILIANTVLNILLTVWFIRYWGIVGAAIATAVSLLLGQILLLNIYYYKALSVNAWTLYRKAYHGILPAELLAMLAGGGTALLIPNKYLSFLCGGIVFVLVELVCLLWFGLNQSEREQVNRILIKLKIKKK